MNDPIHAHLDGDVPLEDLSREQRMTLRGYRRALDRTLDVLHRDPAPDVSATVMERIRRLEEAREAAAAPATRGGEGRHAAAGPAGAASDGTGPARGSRPGWAPWLDWLWRPRTVSARVRPAWALAAAAFALVLLRPGGGPGTGSGAAIRPGGTVVAASRADGRVLVRFHLDAPGARSVALAGDFTGWHASEPLTETAPGLWTVVVAVQPGVHEYAFVVDGDRWVEDPLAERVADGFGGVNSRVAVLPPAGPEGA